MREHAHGAGGHLALDQPTRSQTPCDHRAGRTQPLDRHRRRRRRERSGQCLRQVGGQKRGKARIDRGVEFAVAALGAGRHGLGPVGGRDIDRGDVLHVGQPPWQRCRPRADADPAAHRQGGVLQTFASGPGRGVVPTLMQQSGIHRRRTQQEVEFCCRAEPSEQSRHSGPSERLGNLVHREISGCGQVHRSVYEIRIDGRTHEDAVRVLAVHDLQGFVVAVGEHRRRQRSPHPVVDAAAEDRRTSDRHPLGAACRNHLLGAGLFLPVGRNRLQRIGFRPVMAWAVDVSR